MPVPHNSTHKPRGARQLFLLTCLAGLTACGAAEQDAAEQDKAPAVVASEPVVAVTDAARLSDVMVLAAAIRDWHASHGSLPVGLDRAYGYEILGDEDYQICADFDAANRGGEVSWQHGSGRHCFRLSPGFAQY
jgi:hypothetical protein